MVDLIENYQLSWQEMLGCRNFPFSLNRTPFKGLRKGFSSQWLKIPECSNSELPVPWVTMRLNLGLTDCGLWSPTPFYCQRSWFCEWAGWVLHNLLQGHRASGWRTHQCIQIPQVLETSSSRPCHDHPSDSPFWFTANGSRIPKGHLFWDLEARTGCGGMQTMFYKTHALTTSHIP